MVLSILCLFNGGMDVAVSSDLMKREALIASGIRPQVSFPRHMETGKDILMVFVTASNEEEAARISDEALNSHEAACATTIPTVHSKYWWEGKLVNDQESIVILKTTVDRFEALQQTILKVHAYKVPEIIAVPVRNGLPQYLEWVRRETSQ